MVLKRFNTNSAWFSIAGMGSFLIKKQVNTRYRTQFIAPPVIPNSAKNPKQIPNGRAGFSLVEMLMALLVASLLLAALAPVMTKRMNENMHITGSFSQNTRSEIREIKFGDPDFCNKIVRDSNNNPLYCEGEYVVPQGFKNITVTAIGGGGGGGTAPTAGYTEFTTAGSTNNFFVPAMVNQLEATLISGGAGGGAGGQTFVNKDWLEGGQYTWDIPEILKGKYALVTACGGGGGGGGSSDYQGGGGGSGGYIVDKSVSIPNIDSLTVQIGGGGGAGGADNLQGHDGHSWDGGGGGSGINVISQSYPVKSDGGGRGGNCTDDNGGYGGIGGNYQAQNGQSGAVLNSLIRGGLGGNGGGKGGDAPASGFFDVAGSNRTGGGGGGGGSFQGGGGGGAGAGSGGGGGGATVFYQTAAPNGSSQLFYAPGGGGGGGGGNSTGLAKNQGGGGGGGGGNGGGNGGNAGGVDANGNKAFAIEGSPGSGGTGGNSGSGINGGVVSTIFGVNHCSGGNGALGKLVSGSYQTGNDGKDGAMRIKYLSYGSGGSGGGSGRIYALYPVSVSSKENLKVIVGKGGKGGMPGHINNSGEQTPIEPSCDFAGGTYIRKADDTILLGYAQSCYYGGYPGHSQGTSCGIYNAPDHGEGAWVFSTLGQAYPIVGGMSGAVPSGFFGTNGRPAGDNEELNCDASTIANATIGGRGGSGTTPFTGTCIPGAGGKNPGEAGGNAQGYGCGGGGGFGLSNGGNGSGGYARISWNMYWDTALNSGTGAYKYAEIGAGGGGASGNAVTETIRVAEGQVIKVRIGAGGAGAKVVNNEIVPANPGGTTIFGDSNFIEIKAGGGGGGESPAIVDNTLINGKGGEISRVCDVGSRKYIDNQNHCTKGKPGANADDNDNKALGGKGADFSYDKYSGTGGLGGMQDTGENSNGKNADAAGVSAGGGGAAIRIFNSAIAPSNVLNNPNRGGDGASGMIILKLWE